jgi:hypothetical protein
MKYCIDYSKYRNVLCASEIFDVYQPLLGWRRGCIRDQHQDLSIQ